VFLSSLVSLRLGGGRHRSGLHATSQCDHPKKKSLFSESQTEIFGHIFSRDCRSGPNRITVA
jgi:hypothetical protein